MTRYQELKIVCERLSDEIGLFRDALDIHVIEVCPVEDGNLSSHDQSFLRKYKIKDENLKRRLQLWVADNLDRDTIMHLLDLKEKIKNDE